MAAQIADRLTIQEEEIRWLSDEIGRLLELGMHGNVDNNPSPELEQLRTENEKLRYRIVHLQRCLEEEQDGGRRAADAQHIDEGQTRPDHKESPPEEEITQQRGRDVQRPQAESACEDKGENSVVERPSASQNKKKKEKKASKEVDGEKQERRSTKGREVNPGKQHLAAPPRFSKSGPPDSLQLIQRREYWDLVHRPWKVIFPLEEDLNEPVSTIILKRLEELREPATQDHIENVKLPRWLEQQGKLHFRSSDSTWTVLFQDPSPDTYLLLLKKCIVPLEGKLAPLYPLLGK